MKIADIVSLGREPFDYEFTLPNGKKATVALVVPLEDQARAIIRKGRALMEKPTEDTAIAFGVQVLGAVLHESMFSGPKKDRDAQLRNLLTVSGGTGGMLYKKASALVRGDDGDDGEGDGSVNPSTSGSPTA